MSKIQFFQFILTVAAAAKSDCGREIFVEENTPLFLQTNKVLRPFGCILEPLIKYRLNETLVI